MPTIRSTTRPDRRRKALPAWEPPSKTTPVPQRIGNALRMLDQLKRSQQQNGEHHGPEQG